MYHSCSDGNTNDLTNDPTFEGVAGGGMDVNYNFYHFTPKMITPETKGDIILEIHNESFLSSSNPVLTTSWGESITLFDEGKDGDRVANDLIFTARLKSQSIIRSNTATNLNKPLVGQVNMGSGGIMSIYAEVWNNSTFGPVTTLTINDVISAFGARVQMLSILPNNLKLVRL